MTEQKALPHIWASKITVYQTHDFLSVTGTIPVRDDEVEVNRDVFLGYVNWVRDCTQKRTELISPHIQFANSNTDEKLVAFVRAFGPVAADFIHEIIDDHGWKIGANQSMEALRREHRIYATALLLLAELEKEKGKADLATIRRCISQICEGCKYWIKECAEEGQWRTQGVQPPLAWKFGMSEWERLERLMVSAEASPSPRFRSAFVHLGRAFECGHDVICLLINAFAVEVQHSDVAFEAPPWGSLRFGVRPALYYVLRHEYLRRRGIRLCANARCNQFFSVERGGQAFCSEICSRNERQRQYWKANGSSLRRRRLKKKKKKLR